MGRKLADDLVGDVEKTFLNADHFAEAVTHQPVEGAAESFTALVTEHQQQRPTDNAQGTRQTATAELMLPIAAAVNLTVGRGTEVSKFTFHGHSWRAISSHGDNAAIVVQVERNITAAVKKGWQQGGP